MSQKPTTMPATATLPALSWRYLRPQGSGIALLGLLLAGSIVLQLALPQIVRNFLDTAQRGGALTVLATAAGLYLGSVALGQLLDALAAYAAGRVGWAATNALRSDLVAHVLRLDRSFFARHTPGELIERVDGDVLALFNLFAQFALRVLGSVLLLLGALVLLSREHWQLGALLLGYMLIASMLLQWLRKRVLPATRALRQNTAALSGFWAEYIPAGDDLNANGAQGWALGQQQTLLEKWQRSLRQAAVSLRSLTVAAELLLAIANGALFLLGAALIAQGQLSIGGLYAAYAYTGLISHNMWQLAEQLADLQTALAGFERIAGLLATPSAVSDGPGAVLAPGALTLCYQHVSYSYEHASGDQASAAGATYDDLHTDHASAPTLRNISFELPAGMMLGLVGRTGSGKSTLARLLLRFDDPQQGAILLNGMDIRQLTLQQLREHVGFVTQDVQIFHASLRDNLSVFDERIHDAQLWQALDDLGLRGWAQSLPQGLDAPLAPGMLSAGEAQLIAFARVFLRSPGLVILDEATARLDPATEQLIEQALSRLLRGRSAVVIAHRLSTLQHADRILVLEQGQIAEYGETQLLKRDPGSRYASMLHALLDPAQQPEHTNTRGETQ